MLILLTSPLLLPVLTAFCVYSTPPLIDVNKTFSFSISTLLTPNISSPTEERFIIKGSNYNWKKWMVTLGDIVEISEGVFVLQHGEVSLRLKAETKDDVVTITFPPLAKSKSSIRFMYLFKNALNKSAYCMNCKECMAECPNGVLTITDDDIIIKNCKHCEKCLDKPKGCVIAKSKTTTGYNNISAKTLIGTKTLALGRNGLRYILKIRKTFGPMTEWVPICLRVLKNGAKRPASLTSLMHHCQL